jgi:hypothetical protein
MINKKKLLQLSTENNTEIDSPFTEWLKRQNHTPYSLDIKRINLENTPEYNKEVIFNIPLNSDLLYRCFFEIVIPNIDITTEIISKINTNSYQDYLTFKNNKLASIQNIINYWENNYNVFLSYSNIQSQVYVEIKNIIKINNFTIDYIKSNVLSIINNVSNFNQILLQIDSNILVETNIIEFITNYTNQNNRSIDDVKNEILNTIEKKYENLKNYLEYLYKNKIYHQKKYNNENNNKIYYRWIENLNHFYCKNFEFFINGISIDSYSNDYLNIYMKHTLADDYEDLYDKISRNDDSLYDNTDYSKKIYTPLLFSFCDFFDSTKALPLIALQNSNLMIKANINKLTNLIYFNDWEELYNKTLFVDIPRREHTKSSFNNVEVFNFDNIEYESVELIIPENIYRYKFKNINRINLQRNFEGIDFELILNTYGIDDENGNKVLNLNEWLYMINNIKNDTSISETSKIVLLDYHYFIDYNYLLNLIPKPNINLLIETGYIDDIEKKLFMNRKLEYLIKTKQEVVFDIGENSLFESLNDITGLVKECYFIIQPNLHKNGFTLYSKSELNKYKNFNFIDENGDNIYDNLELSISNEYNLLNYSNENFNNVIGYSLLNSNLPDGVIYKSFGLYHRINQPSGSINLSTASGQNFLIEINNELFENYLENINNSNSFGFSVKLIYVKYNMLHIEKGIGELIFYN